MKRPTHRWIALLAGWLITAPAFAAPPAPAGTIDTIAGDGDPAVLGQPFGVAFGPDGALYICEVENHRVRRLDPHSGDLTTVAGNGREGYAGDGGPADRAALNEPYEVRFDDRGDMYFVEMRNHIVRRVDGRTGVIVTIAGLGEPGFSGDGGPAVEARLRRPHSIAIDDARRHLYIADIGNHRIRRVHLDLGMIETIAGDGQKQPPRDGQPAAGQPMLGPRALFIRGRTLWIALREGHSIWTMDLDSGVLHHIAGTGESGYGGDGGDLKLARFNGPKGIALDDGGRVFIADTENQAIRMIDPARNLITTVAGDGRRGYGGDGGPAAEAALDRPHGVIIGPDGSLYIGDTNNHSVRRVILRSRE